MNNIETLIEQASGIRQSKPSKALRLYQIALSESESSNNEEFRVKSLFNIAITYLILGDYDRSLKSFFDTLNTKYTAENPDIKCEILRGIAGNYARKYNYREALKYFYLSEQDSILSDHMENLHLVYQGISSLYSRLSLFKKALAYSQKAFDIAVQNGEENALQTSLMSTGACYYKLGDHAEAEKYFSKSLELSANSFAEANTLHFISAMKFDSGEYNEAENCAKRQINICSKFNYYDFEALGYRMLGKLCFKKNDNNSALMNFEKAVKILNVYGDRTVKFAVLNDLIEVYKSIGNKDKVIELYSELYNEHTKHLENEVQLKIEQFDIENETEIIKKEIDKEKKYSSIMKKTLLDVNALNIELKNIHDEQNNLMGLLAHDLKNPLQSIISALKLMQSEKNDEQFRDEMESNIKHQSERMLILINRLLDHRSISEGSVKIKISEFNSKELISKLTKNSSISAVKKDINLISECSECGITVKNDHDMLYQILENLLSNSVKFSPVGSDIYVRCRRSGDKNIFEIEDSGPGFTDEDKKKLYSNFAKLSAKPTGNEHSTGLGLSIVKKLCELIGAEIELFSEFGKGTKFIVKL